MILEKGQPLGGPVGAPPKTSEPQIQAPRVEGLGRLIQLRIWAWEVIVDGLGGSTKRGIVQGGGRRIREVIGHALLEGRGWNDRNTISRRQSLLQTLPLEPPCPHLDLTPSETDFILLTSSTIRTNLCCPKPQTLW